MRRLLALALILAPPASPAAAGEGRFLLISDIHFDPFYDGSLFGRLRELPADRWAGVLEGSRPAGVNPRGTDSNYALLKGALDEAHARLPDPDFVLYPGDLMAHRWQAKYDRLAPKSHRDDPAAYRAFTTEAIRFLAAEFRKRYPDAAILPTLGNDDSYCGDYAVEPDGPFLAMFAATWGPLLGAGPDRGAFRETFARGGYYTLPLPGPAKHRLVVLNSVLFSVNYNDACAPGGGTPALDQLRWLDEALGRAGAAGEAVWLLMHIPPGINSFNSAASVPRGGPAATFWQPELTGRFLQVVRRHPGTIRAAFAGHTHMDDFRVIPGAPGRDIPCKIAPAISPIFGNNPGFQVYRYDRASGAPEDYRCYFLPDRPDAPGEGGGWAPEYDFRTAYGLGPPAADSFTRLAAAMAEGGGARRLYSKFYGVGAPPEFTARTIEYYRCAIANVTPAEFLTCAGGRPEPDAPPAFPDRRPPPGGTPR